MPDLNSGEAVLWVNPDDLANPMLIGIGSGKAGHELTGKHYTLPLYAAPQPASVVEGFVLVDPTVRYNQDGSLDEVIGSGTFHVEQMGTTHWWMQVGPHAIYFTSKAKIKATIGLNEAVPAARGAGG